jgi:hypothetical protein
MRADLNVYIDAAGAALERGVRKEFRSAQNHVERSRLAYRTAREKLIQHVDAHG